MIYNLTFSATIYNDLLNNSISLASFQGIGGATCDKRTFEHATVVVCEHLSIWQGQQMDVMLNRFGRFIMFIDCSLHWFRAAKVSCRDAIKQARVTRVRSKGLKALSRVNLKKSETGAHRVFKSFGSSLEVPISKVDLPSAAQFPYVKFEDWLHYLVKHDELDCLVGTKDLPVMQQMLTSFWEKYRQVHSTHVIFTRNDINKAMTIPVLFHGDEGRGLKKKQVMILSTHGVCGSGTSKTPELVDSFGHPENPLALNMVGRTVATHFLLGAMPINLYNNSPESFYRVLEIQSDEFTYLFEQGTVIEGRRYYVCCIGIKGDAPFLAKAGRFERNFARRPTKKVSKKPCCGICHLCTLVYGRKGGLAREHTL